jgi:hypothetical protein
MCTPTRESHCDGRRGARIRRRRRSPAGGGVPASATAWWRTAGCQAACGRRGDDTASGPTPGLGWCNGQQPVTVRLLRGAWMVAPGMALTRVLLPPLLLCATAVRAQQGQQALLTPSTPAPALPIPIGAVTNGTCGHTGWSVACDTASRGAFDARKEGIKDLAGCAARVKQCKQGAFASFSVDHNDCSWYSACDGWPRLEDATLYQTERVRGPPPPPGSSPSPPVSIEIDWTKETRRASTAATVEVDVMPFLARQPETDPYVTGHCTSLPDPALSTICRISQLSK